MTKDEMKAWNESDNNFYAMNIELNGPDVSDIIVISEKSGKKKFENMMTGKNSNCLDDVVRDGRRFIISTTKDSSIRGYYITTDKEHDILIFVQAHIKEYVDPDTQTEIWRWGQDDILRRAYITREGYSFGLKYFYCFDEIDICGQTVLLPDVEHEYYHTYSVGSKRTALEYFGGIPCVSDYDDEEALSLMHFTRARDVDGALDLFEDGYTCPIGETTDKDVFNCNESWYFHPGEVLCGNYINGLNKYVKDNLSIPDAAKKEMELFAKKVFMCGCKNAAVENMQFIEHRNCVSILQKDGNRVVQRLFYTFFDYAYPVETTKVSFVEYKRIYYDENIKPDLRGFSNCPPIWHDPDMSGTVMEHTIDIVDDYINLYNENIRYAALEDIEEALILVYDKYEREHGAIARRCAYMAAAIGNDSVAEKLMRAYENYPDAKKGLLHDMAYGTGLSLNMYGCINRKEKTLHQILGLPKGLFEYMLDTNTICSMGSLKNMFSRKEEHTSYFLRMNSNAYIELVDFLYKEPHELSCLAKEGALTNLIIARGVKNIKGYIRFIRNIGDNDCYKFCDYVKLLRALGDVAKDADWKLSGEALKKSYNSLKAVTLLMEEGNYEELKEKYQKLNKKWEKFQYSDNDYQIVCPKRPEDIVIEGLTLNHCVKEFVVPVAEEKTTILFIRRMEKLEKPYYTLEIRDNAVRQCHGNSNSKIDDVLKKFLDGFCKQNNLAFDSEEAGALLGA